MNSKGQRGHCIYNRQWVVNSKYKGWLTAFKADKKMIDILNIGESALKIAHEK